MRSRTLALILLLLLLILSAGGAAAGRSPVADPNRLAALLASPHLPDQLLVRFADGADARAVAGAHGRAGATQIGEIGPIKAAVVQVAPGQLRAALQHYLADPAVRWAEPNYLVKASFTPDDPDLPRQWGLAQIQAEGAWEIQQGDPGIIVAVVDTGVDPLHPDLSAKLVPGWNYVLETENTADDNGHGTHVAGIVAAATNNGLGVAGIGFRTSIMPVKVLGADGSGTNDNVARGITYAADNGARVISLSLGGSGYSQAIQDAVDHAWLQGALVVAAAGNDGNDTVNYPAGAVGVVAVAATDANDQRAAFSNYGSHIAVAAPGVGIWSTFWNGSSTYASLSGTSMATPFVSGLAALLFAQDPTRTNDAVQAILQNTADDLDAPGWDPYTGYGRINALRALSGSVAGQVTHAITDAAIGGATVTISQLGTLVASTLTAADGTYSLSGLKAGSYDLAVSAPGYQPASAAAVQVTSGAESRVDFALQPVPGALAGTVTSSRGGAIAGALVEARQGGVLKGSATTAADGTYSITGLPEGSYDLTASATGYEPATTAGVSVVSGQTTSGVNFALTKARR